MKLQFTEGHPQEPVCLCAGVCACTHAKYIIICNISIDHYFLFLETILKKLSFLVFKLLGRI